MRPGKLFVAALLCLIITASPALAASPQSASISGKHSVPLSLTLQGQITNAGSQFYSFGGGQLVEGSVFGTNLSPGHLNFNLFASVHGLSVSGRGSLVLSTSQGGHSDHDHDPGTGLSAQIYINGAVPAAIFPITVTSLTSYASCDPTSQHCNSEIPILFTGVATIMSDGAHHAQQIPIAVESPYWSPFGGPIVITSLDSSTNPTIFLVVSYDTASIQWMGVQLQGMIAGTFGTEGVTGSYGQVVNSQENLVAGAEIDGGTIAFVGMSDPVLNAHGFLFGHTGFSLAGSFDCSSEFGLPEGTCTATGATSDGSFSMIGSQVVFVSGTYHTVWSVPSLFTQTIVLGAVIQH